jgi:hypothetical protein
MEHPISNSNTKVIQFFEKDFTPYSDIVWSFDYYVTDISANSNLGFCIFLQDAYNLPLSSYQGGNSTIDLGYSGLSAKNTSWTIASSLSAGLSGALIGVGFDSTGSFAVSATSSSTILRDGVSDNQRINNSVSIRGAAPYYKYSEYNINRALSAYNFNVLDSTKKTIRARLGNVGRTLYVDYRYSADEDYINIITQDVTFTITPSSRIRPGITFATQVSSSPSVPRVFFSNLTVEGRSASPTLQYGNAFQPLTTFALNTTACLISGCPYADPRLVTPTALPKLLLADPSVIINSDSIEPAVDTANISLQLKYAVNGGYGLQSNMSVFFTGTDYFNFGYKLNIVGPCTNTSLYRTDYFNYASTDNSLLLSLTSFDGESKWQLVTNTGTYNSSTNMRPVGIYSSTTTALTTFSITYANE